MDPGRIFERVRWRIMIESRVYSGIVGSAGYFVSSHSSSFTYVVRA